MSEHCEESLAGNEIDDLGTSLEESFKETEHDFEKEIASNICNGFAWIVYSFRKTVS